MKHSLNTRSCLTGFILAGALAGAASLTGCQEVNQPTTTLTQAQWQEVKANLLDEVPEPQYPVGAKFDGKIELIGFDIDKPLVAGQPATFTWYWKALTDIKDHWQVFVHLDSSEKSYRQHLDHHPMGGLYQTGRWKKGQIIKDIQKITLNKDYPQGQAVPYIGFYKGEQRLAIENGVKQTKDRRVIGPALMVKNPTQKTQKANLPDLSVLQIDDAELAEAKVDGKLDEAFWAKAQPVFLSSLGAAPDLKTEVRVLRGSDHLLIGAKLPDEHVWGNFDKRDADLWTEEVFEVYIDSGRDGKDYLELQISPLGTIFDAKFVDQLGRGEGTRDEQINRARSWNMDGLESAVAVNGTVNDASDKDEAWTVELKIPFTSIPGVDAAPKDGTTWAVNFYRFDRPDEKRTYAYAWSKPTKGDFHQYQQFGNLKFGKVVADAAPELREMNTLKAPRQRKLQLDPKKFQKLQQIQKVKLKTTPEK